MQNNPNLNDNAKWITHVGCCVDTCSYHTPEHFCSAQHIDVENKNAQKKDETFCGTFAPKS